MHLGSDEGVQAISRPRSETPGDARRVLHLIVWHSADGGAESDEPTGSSHVEVGFFR